MAQPLTKDVVEPQRRDQPSRGDTRGVVVERPPATWWNDVWRRFRRQRLSMVALAFLLVLTLIALLAPWLAPHDPIMQFRREGLTLLGEPVGPNRQFWLGTDGVGRDMLSRLMWGGRVSLGVGLSASAIAVTIALVIGGGAGFLGGKVDFFLMRFVDLMMLLVTLFRPSAWIVIVVISVFAWTYPARVFRSQILALKQQDFILAAYCLGVPRRRVFLRHILPHLLSLVIVYLALTIPTTIFAEAGLSFLGLGVPPPYPSWGSMIQQGQAYYRAAPWVVLFPGIAIMLTVVAFNLLGAGLRDVLDPTRRGR
jgi:peptide/nickel transport system permease protein